MADRNAPKIAPPTVAMRFWAFISNKQIPEQLPVSVRDLLSQLECNLVDEDDIDEAWLQTLIDLPNEGAVRERIFEIARATIADH